jgi:Nitronate monooxygenase
LIQEAQVALRTRLTERLGIRHPILLAPMGFVSGGALAAAVSAAGGLGLIGGGYAETEWLNREFAAAGNQRIGCGFITWSMARRPAALDETLRHAPAAVMLSFGDAAPFIPRIKRADALAICQVQSVRQARQVLDGGGPISSLHRAARRAAMARRARLFRWCRPWPTWPRNRAAMSWSLRRGASPTAVGWPRR